MKLTKNSSNFPLIDDWEIWMFSFLGFKKKWHTAIAYATCRSVAFSGSTKAYSAIFIKYVTELSALVGLDKLS